MRTSKIFFKVAGVVFLLSLSNPPCNALTNSVYAPLVAGDTDFALSLFSQLEAGNSNNIFFSPYSISTCFGMVYAGARGATARQMAEALDFSTNQTAVGPEFGALQAELNARQSVDGIDLSVANGLWAQTNFPFLPAFLDNAGNNFDATVQPVNFVADAAQISDQINEWVADQTQGMIPGLLQPGSLTPLTRLVLVNAIYFNGEWLSIFDTNLTTVAPFYISPNEIVEVPMMGQMETAKYYEDNLLQAIELPYTNTSLSMVVLLPKSSGPPTLTPAELSAALDGLAPTWLEVELPKFKLDQKIDLVPILENMGMLDAFMPGVADFSGIDGQTDLSIDQATHEAIVEVNETGTAAAAATAIGVIATAFPNFTSFQANHPFVFLIRDTNSGSILFLGRVEDPTSGAAPGTTLAAPKIQTSQGSFGFRNRQFGFNVASTNSTVRVEKCANLASGIWVSVQTLTPTNGSAYFSDPLPPDGPSRFYRVVSP